MWNPLWSLFRRPNFAFTLVLVGLCLVSIIVSYMWKNYLVGALNQEKALIGAFSVIAKSLWTFESLEFRHTSDFCDFPASLVPSSRCSTRSMEVTGSSVASITKLPVSGLGREHNKELNNRWLECRLHRISLMLSTYSKCPLAENLKYCLGRIEDENTCANRINLNI